MRTLLAVGVFVSLAACSEQNPYYCPGLPDDNCRNDGGDIPMGCTTSTDCTNAAKPVCDTTQKLCVACTADDVGSCGGNTPVCSTTNTCTACSDDDQCDSGVCLADGSCASVSQVAFLSATGDDASGCTEVAPCKSINVNAPKKPYLKLLSDLDEAVVLTGVSVTIVGKPGVAVRRSTDGPIFDITGTGNVTIRDLAIRDARGNTGIGVRINTGEPTNLTLDRVAILGSNNTGLVAQGSGTLTMSRCTLSNNNGGGAKLEQSYAVTNTLFVRNGNASSNFGGVFLNTNAPTSFKFNTVANNVAASSPQGMTCVGTKAISSTIVSSNAVSSDCQFEHSLFDTGITVSGTNHAGDPKFKNTDGTAPLAAVYFRILPTSDAVNKADPSSTMNTDIDGDARPQGSADIGADEVP
jgi:hypothetical protein